MIIPRQKIYSKKNDAELAGEEIAKVGKVIVPAGLAAYMAGTFVSNRKVSAALDKHGLNATRAGLGLIGAGNTIDYIGTRVRKRRESGRDNVIEKKPKKNKESKKK